MPYEPLLRREYVPQTLLKAHPPKLKHPHKQVLFDLACPPDARHAGPIRLSRWPERALPKRLELHATQLTVTPGLYDYRGSDPGVWHVNFADPQLFVAYGSQLLAQDELQAVEHPLLGSVREALLAENVPALTEESCRPTPVLVANVERRCELQTAPALEPGRVQGLYGNRFAEAPAAAIVRALHVLRPATLSNLVAIAAPSGGRGPYFRKDLEGILLTAYSGFSAACVESERLAPGVPIEVRTGFWGCGAFGGNRRVMTLLQVLAARLCGVNRLTFYAFDAAGEAEAQEGIATLTQCLAAGHPNEDLDVLIERIADLDFSWGVSDGT